jgi:hypothetical protein
MSKARQLASLLDSTSAAGWLHMASGQSVEDVITKFEIRISALPNTDVGAKINAAAAANPGAIIRLPRGIFLLSTRVNITSANTVIEGSGTYGTVLYNTTTASSLGAIRFGPADPTSGDLLTGCGIKNLTLQNTYLGVSGVGLLAEQVLDFDDVGVNVKDFFVNRDLVGFSNPTRSRLTKKSFTSSRLRR